ncbi:protein translocase SEC61 complex subunit gamma [Candidatus Pacearchaeota archaeon]|nr:protein translocase SEC61 complex subunit gamma [Candidatus Pacearchaeota archaeon]
MKFLVSVKDFMLKCARVWRVLRKPSKEEFKIIAKVSMIGMLIIGFLGFVIGVIMTLMKIK